VPAVPALPTAGLLQALAPKRGVPPPVRGPAPLGVPKQQLEAMAKRLAMEAQVSAASTPANKKGRALARSSDPPVRGSGSSGFAERAQRRGNNPECFRKPEAQAKRLSHVSHATTPSWRSRNKWCRKHAQHSSSTFDILPFAVLEPRILCSTNAGTDKGSISIKSLPSTGTSEMACKPAMMAESIRPRLSPLLEARWAVLAVSLYEGSGHFGSIVVEEQRYQRVPQSELERLDRIDPEVDEVL
ncbi:unnamed protein product, partial [Symbiodinium necroappetens]